MKKINLAAVPVQESHSPKGRFRYFSQDLLTAMRQTNGDRMTNVRFPFDIKLVSLPPRAANGPYRSHSARWVYYQIITGRGVVRTPGGKVDVREGDCIMHPPGEAHQLLNTGATDLVYHLITDNPESDACYYPDSDKWSLPGHSRPVRVQPADYYDGEE
ncbi:MAG: cupin domain-containing protein [Verrucomicrobiota bacterium]